MKTTRYQGRYFSILEDEQGDEFVGCGNAVLIVPVTDEGEVLTIREPSTAFGEPVQLLPGGELTPGEQPDACANRELQEEIGLRAGRLDFLGELRPFSKYLTVRVQVFLARDLVPNRLQGDEGYEIEIIPLPIEAMGEAIRRGQLKDAPSCAALFLAREFIQNER